MVFKKIKFIAFIILLLALYNKSFAQQELITKQPIENLIDYIASSSDDEIDYTSLYEDLNFFLNNPLNINLASKEELERLKILNDFQIKSLLDYIKQHGKMLSVYELQLVYGFTMNDILTILPFITISDTPVDVGFKFKNALKYGNNQVFLKAQDIIEDQVGYSYITDSALLENPNSR